MKTDTRFLRILRFLLGTALALTAAELLLRPVFRGPELTLAGEIEPGTESISFLEGFALCRWGVHGSRGSGASSEGMQPVIVVGDSYVEAIQVANNALMSSLLEHRLRSEGISNAVLSLGRSGASVADYVGESAQLTEWFHQAWTIVVLGREDFSEAMDSSRKYYFSRDTDSGPLVVRPGTRSKVVAQDTLQMVYHWLLNESSLFKLGCLRAKAFIEGWRSERPLFGLAPTSSDKLGGRGPDEIPPVKEQLAALKATYAGRLTILYRSPGASPRNPPLKSAMDLQIEHAANDLDIGFVSLSSYYSRAMSQHEMPNGFSNTQPFVGHWNQNGHRLAADAVAPELLRALR